MKTFLIAALVLSSAAPVVVVPTFADAQVLIGRGAARSAERRSRPALSVREEDRLFAAMDQVAALQEQIDTLETDSQATGGPTPEQATEIAARRAEMAEAQTVIDRLEAKRARHAAN